MRMSSYSGGNNKSNNKYRYCDDDNDDDGNNNTQWLQQRMRRICRSNDWGKTKDVYKSTWRENCKENKGNKKK